MHGQIESINDARNGQLIKCFHKLFVDVLVIEHESLIAEVE